jgi:hypothetical protein
MAFDFVTYMKDVATRLKEIQHTEKAPRFFRVGGLSTLEELLLKATTAKDMILCVENNYEGKIGENQSSILDNMYHTFYIAKYAPVNDIDKIEQSKEDSKKALVKIWSKMFHDKLVDQQGGPKLGLRNLDKPSIYYRPIGPIGNGFYGMLCIFTNSEKPGAIYNEEDWLEI